MEKRLDDIYKLRPGWLDGQGLVPNEIDLNWLENLLGLFYPKDLVTPYFYPTPEGGLLIEWPIGDEDISLEVDFKTQTGSWHQLNLKNDAEIYQELDLNDPVDWEWIVRQIECL